MGVVGVVFALFVVVVCCQHARWQWRNRRKKNPGRYRGGVALGNALQAMQAITQPHVKHVIATRLEEETDVDDEISRDAATHLLRQAKRIRKGEEIDRLTTFLRL